MGKAQAVWRWIGIGCGALVVLGVLALGAVMCGAIIGSVGSNQGSSSSSQSGQASKGGATVAIGQPVDAGKVQWTVTNAYRTNQLRGRSGQRPKQGNFVVVDFTFKNNDDKAVTLDTSSLSLIDSQGRSSNAAPDVFEYIPQDKQIFLSQVNPGVSKDGEAIFSVSPDARGFKLDAGDTNPITDNDGYVDLSNI